MRVDAVVSMGAAASAFITPDVTVAYVGVPLNVLFACAAGTYAAFAVNREKIEPRSRMWCYAFACILMGGMFTSAVQFAVEYATDKEVGKGLLAGMGGICSFVVFFMLPVIAEVIRSKEWVNWIPFLNRNDRG